MIASTQTDTSRESQASARSYIAVTFFVAVGNRDQSQSAQAGTTRSR